MGLCVNMKNSRWNMPLFRQTFIVKLRCDQNTKRQLRSCETKSDGALFRCKDICRNCFGMTTVRRVTLHSHERKHNAMFVYCTNTHTWPRCAFNGKRGMEFAFLWKPTSGTPHVAGCSGYKKNTLNEYLYLMFVHTYDDCAPTYANDNLNLDLQHDCE